MAFHTYMDSSHLHLQPMGHTSFIARVCQVLCSRIEALALLMLDCFQALPLVLQHTLVILFLRQGASPRLLSLIVTFLGASLQHPRHLESPLQPPAQVQLQNCFEFYVVSRSHTRLLSTSAQQSCLISESSKNFPYAMFPCFQNHISNMPRC